jgi:hypothetical protein
MDFDDIRVLEMDFDSNAIDSFISPSTLVIRWLVT